MFRLRNRVIVLALGVAFAWACDKNQKPAEGKPEPAAPQAKAPAETKESGAQPATADNPHAGMLGHGSPAPDPAGQAGPPRDITPSGETTDEKIAELAVALPKEWEKGTPTSSMRLAQYALPGPGGDAELVIYRFKGGAGGVEENVARWKGQFQPPEGKSLDDISKVEKLEVGDLNVTFVDITGRYVAAVRPGAEQKHDSPDYRMLAAIIEGSGDPFFLKATGPAKTLDVWAESFRKMLEGAKTS